MSAAGTPSTDPWVILAREKARYEEQFKSLKPINGIVTGEQAKGFLLQSQLPPQILGQIWALADTDLDGKMDIKEFSIACKLINLKLRGFDIPKMLPPSLLASLRPNQPPAIPPLPNPALMSQPPARPEPPRSATATPTPPGGTPLIPPVGGVPMVGGGIPPVGTVAPMGGLMGTAGGVTGIPTGVVPPMPSTIPPIQQQPLISGLPMSTATPPLSSQSLIGQQTTFGAPLVPGLSNTASIPPTMGIAPTPLISGIAPVPMSTAPIGAPPSGGIMSPVAAIPPAMAQSTPRGSVTSVTSLERAGSIESVPQVEWSVPHQTKLKYTQIFNTTDRARTGYLSGAQARNVMVQTKLPQNLLAQIWALADMDVDGRLGCEEFVLAMHLCEQAAMGNAPPAKLPQDLVPPSFRRTRTSSVSSQGSAAVEQDAASLLLQNSFEDKRKENFEKGQAELERRRKTLLDQQRKEAEERERKEREELERKEKARQEAERKRLDELEKQMREQQEKERLLEEERKRQAEQREAARKEMERQRQLEWEKQRLQELQQQRQREQENVLKLKAKNQSLTIELSTLNEQVKELSQKICDTRVGVSNVKSTIDGMRSTRDAQMAEMSQLKNRLKDQNAKLLALSQEKIKLDAKNKINQQISGPDAEQQRIAFENKEITIKHLKEKVADMQTEIDSKMTDIENNNMQLTELRTQMQTLINECEKLYTVYEVKRDKVLEMKNKPISYENAWQTESPAWGETNTTSGWPTDSWGSAAPPGSTDLDIIPGVHKYKAIYEFVARNNDEISFQPGDIINVPEQQTGEPGWLAGEIRGHTGWFPEAYVEPLDGFGIGSVSTTPASATFPESVVSETEKGITEIPEISNEPIITEQATIVSNVEEIEGEIEYYIANYPYQSQEPGDLTFNAGEVIGVFKKDGDWWTGKLGDNVGIFPSNYVQKVDVNSAAAPTNNVAPAAEVPVPIESTGVSAEAVKSALESAQMDDNEVSQINEEKSEKTPTEKERPSSSQVTKGKKPEIASVIAPYQASSSEQLSLARGQLIMIRKKTDSGWWEGELQAKGRKRQVGWFPASYVKVLNSSGKISGRTTPVSTTRMQQEVVIDKVVALYPYTAGNPDELTFAKDDIISVTAREEEAWWRGELNGISGLFPSNYVAPLQQQSTPTSFSDKHRQGSINELIQTEKAYVQDMSIVHDVFEIPLRKSKIISSKDIDEIFVNWQDILQVNKNFLNDLTNCYNSGSDAIGEIICKHLPLMTAYITFCGKQLDSAALLQKLTESSTAFRELVRKCQNNVATKGMPLSSFLIKPMQRITRYPLLISKILENTPGDHIDYKKLEEAHRIAVKFLSCVNENVRLREDEERMSWLQQCVQNDLNLVFNSNTNKLGPRQLHHYGTLTKLKSGKELLGFLFNDFFMLVQPSKSMQFSFQRNSNITYKMYKQPILIQHLSISRESTENVEQGTDSNRVLKLQDDKTGYKISLLASTVHDCTLWTKKMEHAKEMYTKIDNLNRQNKRKTQLHLGPTVGRLLVLVQKGKRFVTAGKIHTENIYCKVTLGTQEQLTDIAKDVLNNGNTPQNGALQVPALVWNHSMQFQLRNINEEILTFTVLEQNPYSPDEFLGKTWLKLKDVYTESQNRNGPLTKRLILHQVESGEISVKLDLHMFNNY